MPGWPRRHEGSPYEESVPTSPVTGEMGYDFVDRSEMCAGCPLADSRYVPASGKADTRYFVVGGQPGPTEEKMGTAFRGKAGQMVRDVLSSMKLDPVFTNVLKRRPVGKKPSRSECFRCGMHLIEEMKRHKVHTVLALGQTPFQFLNGDSSLSVRDVHGLPIQMNRFGITFIVVPTFDAGYVLRNGGLDSRVGDEWLFDLEDYKQTVERESE